ncbi:hypothetical protein CBOM_07813 [Ceraceosorus bombacis]|uniref:Uncharacterized protein n=1 Tax=Ceraceosorus bombacis TaxID=401625 RepID=A0A0P1BHD8_9BASI|nr:hypothetical protein CBOM_07813 [Ceraceosorus bombacis]
MLPLHDDSAACLQRLVHHKTHDWLSETSTSTTTSFASCLEALDCTHRAHGSHPSSRTIIRTCASLSSFHSTGET